MSAAIGERVGAVMSADEATVRLYGFGRYAGHEVPPPGVSFLGLDLHELGHENPKIELDNGQVVWGCECWWGAESRVRKMIGERAVVVVDIEKSRKA